MGFRGIVRTLGFQIAIAMSVLIVGTGLITIWQVDGILRSNEESRFEERLLRARGQLMQRIDSDRDLVVTGATVLASQPEMREAIAEQNVVRILTYANDYYQRTGTSLQGAPGLQVYNAGGGLLVRAHEPLNGRQQMVPQEVLYVLRTGVSLGVIREDELLGLSLSGIAPVMDSEGNVVGAVETHAGMDRSFVLSQERLLELSVAIFTDTTVIHGGDAEEVIPPDTITPGVLSAVEAEGAVFMDIGGEPYFATLFPLVNFSDRTIGEVYLGIDKSEILDGVNAVRGHAFRATAAGAAIAVILASALAFVAVRPIRELVVAARRIQANDLDTPIETRGPSEVIELADALEDLRIAVRQTRDAMLSVNRDLASRFDASTASLSETSQELAVMHGILAALGGAAPAGLAGVARELTELDWVEGAAIALANEGGYLSLAATADLVPAAAREMLSVIEGGIAGQRLESGISVADTSAHPRTLELLGRQIGGFAAQPMVEPDGIVGVLIVTSRRALRLTPSRVELLRSVALELAVMLERTELAGEVEENRRIAESVLREMSDGVLVINHADECRVANPAAARILNRSRLELVGESADSILPLGSAAVQTLRRRAADPSSGPVAPLLAEVNGRRLAISAGPFVDADDDPEHAGMMVLIRDLSAEAEADRVKQDFVSMVGHELRTPLTLIRTTIDLLNEGDAGLLNETQARIVEVLHANTDRLMVLINDLLDMSAIDSGRMQIQPQPIDLVEVAREAAEEAQPAAQAKQHQISVDVPAEAQGWADRKRIGQVLANLVGNAIKYTPPGGAIRISVVTNEPWVQVSVSDTGIGIPPEEQAQLFEKFFRTSQGRRTTGGTGLGLAIARSLVELHGGRIWCESDGQSGTTFAFTLPRRQI